MGLMSVLIGTRRSANVDALEQHVLTQLLIDVAEGRKSENDLKSFFLRNAWSKPGAGKRVVHALRKAKLQRADLYPRIRDIVDPIYMAL
jgi:hypothetical protein